MKTIREWFRSTPVPRPKPSRMKLIPVDRKVALVKKWNTTERAMYVQLCASLPPWHSGFSRARFPLLDNMASVSAPG